MSELVICGTVWSIRLDRLYCNVAHTIHTVHVNPSGWFGASTWSASPDPSRTSMAVQTLSPAVVWRPRPLARPPGAWSPPGRLRTRSSSPQLRQELYREKARDSSRLPMFTRARVKFEHFVIRFQSLLTLTRDDLDEASAINSGRYQLYEEQSRKSN